MKFSKEGYEEEAPPAPHDPIDVLAAGIRGRQVQIPHGPRLRGRVGGEAAGAVDDDVVADQPQLVGAGEGRGGRGHPGHGVRGRVGVEPVAVLDLEAAGVVLDPGDGGLRRHGLGGRLLGPRSQTHLRRPGGHGIVGQDPDQCAVGVEQLHPVLRLRGLLGDDLGGDDPLGRGECDAVAHGGPGRKVEARQGGAVGQRDDLVGGLAPGAPGHRPGAPDRRMVEDEVVAALQLRARDAPHGRGLQSINKSENFRY